MGRAPCCDKGSVKKGPWSPDEDEKLKSYIDNHGTGGNWITLPHKIGLKRCGKSCRLRWLNYLRPNINHGAFSDEEDTIICTLYIAIGSRWSIIAAQLPGRTDNDIKNHWNTKLKTMLLGKHHRKNQKNITGRAARNYNNLNHEAAFINNAATADMHAAIHAAPAPPPLHQEGNTNTVVLQADHHHLMMRSPPLIHQAQVAPSFTIPHQLPDMHHHHQATNPTTTAAFSWIHETSLFNDATPTWPNHVRLHQEETGYYGCSTMKVEGMGGFINGTTESILWSAAETMNMYSCYDVEKLYMTTDDQ